LKVQLIVYGAETRSSNVSLGRFFERDVRTKQGKHKPNLVSLVGIFAMSSMLVAQAPLPIAVDQRVRVWTASPAAITGRVISINADFFEITDGGAPVRVARASVQRLEISRGGKSKGAGARKGALWGAIIAGSLGAISLGLQHESVGEDGSSAGKAAALGAWSGGLFGGLIGAGIGAARAGEDWQQVWP
jgi:hypothetical protein